MNVKTLLYLLITPLSIWAVLAIDVERLFRKNKTNQIIIFSVLFATGIAYLAVNFIYDFYEVSKFLG